MSTNKERLLAEAKELGVSGVSARMKEDTIRERIDEHKEGLEQERALASDNAESLPVEVTTEPTKVAANDARKDEDGNIMTASEGAVGDPKVLNPGEEPAAGNGIQDRDYMQAVRDADKSGAFSSVMTTNVEAGIHNEPPPVDEPQDDGKKERKTSDNLADEGTGTGGPSESMA